MYYNTKRGVCIMIEYEYSIRAKTIKPFIEYCERNDYKFISKTEENRIVFENKANRDIIARITTTKSGDEEICLFDFKNKSVGDATFKIAKESLPLQIRKDDIYVIKNMFDVIGFEQSADNLRTRYVYEKDGVKFEIDKYSRPEMNIIGIEGDKNKVDKTYNDLKQNEEFEDCIIE